MSILSQFKDLIEKAPRRTNECWICDVNENEKIYVYGYKFIACLEGTSFQIWKLMDGSLNINQIADSLCKTYRGIDKGSMIESIISYILQLERAGLAAWQSRPLFEDVDIDE